MIRSAGNREVARCIRAVLPGVLSSAEQSQGRNQPEDTVSTYIDPGTAITIARQARAEQIRQAERYHQTRIARSHGVPADGPRPRRRWYILWRHTAIAH